VWIAGLMIWLWPCSLEAQSLNYKKFRATHIAWTCGGLSALETIDRNIATLRALNPADIKKGAHLYYSDLGMAYYKRFLHTKDTDSVRKAIDCFLVAPDKSQQHWNLALCYFILEDCDQGKKWLAEFQARTKRKALDDYTSQMDALLANCDGD
jgi:hypothetical protein